MTTNDEQAKRRDYSYIDNNGRKVNVEWMGEVRIFSFDSDDKRPRAYEPERPMLSDRERK